MLTPEDFKAYDCNYGGAGPTSLAENDAAGCIDEYFQRPAAFLADHKYVAAVDAAVEALDMVDSLSLTGPALKKAWAALSYTLKAIDAAWFPLALAGCVVRTKGSLALVNYDDGEAVWLVGSDIFGVNRCHDDREALFRARLLEMGTASEERARRDLFVATEYIGPGREPLKGAAALALISSAVGAGLLDWNDAEWWWPAVVPERLECDHSIGDPPVEVSYPALRADSP